MIYKLFTSSDLAMHKEHIHINSIPRATTGKPQDENLMPESKSYWGDCSWSKHFFLGKIQKGLDTNIDISIQIKEALMVLFSFLKHRDRCPRNQTSKSFSNKSTSLFPSLVHT